MSDIIAVKIYIVLVFICTIAGSFWVAKRRYSKAKDYIFGGVIGFLFGLILPPIGVSLIFVLKFLFTA